MVQVVDFYNHLLMSWGFLQSVCQKLWAFLYRTLNTENSKYNWPSFTILGLEPTIYHTWGQHANHYISIKLELYIFMHISITLIFNLNTTSMFFKVPETLGKMEQTQKLTGITHVVKINNLQNIWFPCSLIQQELLLFQKHIVWLLSERIHIFSIRDIQLKILSMFLHTCAIFELK